MTKPYTKPALSVEQQAELLMNRGLEVADHKMFIQCLSHVNYYRLSAYWYPFRETDDRLLPGTRFETIWQRYIFDRRLRLLVMDAIELIEVSVKTKVVNTFGLNQGAFGHLEPKNFRPTMNMDRYREFINKLQENAKDSREIFVQHSRIHYDGFPDLPLWKACEIMTFGNMFTMYSLMERNMQKEIAKKYGIQEKVFINWLMTFNYLRNLCAHHGRLWNRELAIRPKVPKNLAEFEFLSGIGNKRIFAALTICKYLLDLISPRHQWEEKLASLFLDFEEIPRKDMGFPENWKNCPIWKE